MDVKRFGGYPEWKNRVKMQCSISLPWRQTALPLGLALELRLSASFTLLFGTSSPVM